ncbi:hypothetical protein K0M31_002844 [Melipona bicolor]|uniref:Uncharacterized protein n=1 Tax=Melipona bicolor TaxID=60889 RepID=A0AA40FZZ7_9HYME|nr:hypothetical protein K0M31_002844 [Melipona bicolor]
MKMPGNYRIQNFSSSRDIATILKQIRTNTTAAQEEDNICSGESFWLLATILEKTDSPDTKEGRRKRERDGNNTISTNEVTGEKGRDDKGKSWESGWFF